MSETINLTATNASLALSGSSPLPVLTSGMQNHVLCHFAFGTAWSDLSKVAVFRAGNIKKSLTREYWIDDCTVAVPPEVLAASGYLVHVGLYGYNGTPDNVIIPTIEACIGKVKIGADPSGDAPADETRPLWLQIQQSLGEISALLTEDKGSAIAAINELVSKIGDLEGLTTEDKNNLVEAVNAKQDALTAGANITIENNVISAVGGSGVQEVFFAVYGSTSLADIITAHQSGKEVICINGNKHYRLQGITGGVALFSSFESPTDYRLSVRADGGWGSASVTMLKADTIPQATDTALGGIKAAARNASTDTQEVKIDTASGKLYVPQSSGTILVFNVKDYGATGGGAVSDSAAIQSALDACNTAGGGTVYFPKGTYLLTTPVKFYSNQYLLGEIGATLLQADTMTDDKVDGNYCNLMRNYNNGGGGYTVTHDVVIDDLTFDGGTQEEAPTTLLAFCHAQNITVKNCKFTNGFSNTAVGNGHDIEYNSSQNVLIANCVHFGNRRTNINSELIQIDTFRLQEVYPWRPDSGTNQNVDGTACDNVRVHGCEFYGRNDLTTSVNSAIGNHDNGSQNIKITNCKFNGCYIGIKPRRCTNQIVSNNLFVDCAIGVLTYGMAASKDCTVLANVFVNCDYTYIANGSSPSPVGFNNYVDGVLYERLTSLDNANDITVPSTLAVKTYVDTAISGAIGGEY